MDHLPRQGFCTFALKSNVTCSRLAPNCKSTQRLGERLVRLVHPFWASFSQFFRQFFDQLFGMLTKHTSFPQLSLQLLEGLAVVRSFGHWRCTHLRQQCLRREVQITSGLGRVKGLLEPFLRLLFEPNLFLGKEPPGHVKPLCFMLQRTAAHPLLDFALQFTGWELTSQVQQLHGCSKTSHRVHLDDNDWPSRAVALKKATVSINVQLATHRSRDTGDAKDSVQGKEGVVHVDATQKTCVWDSLASSHPAW